MITSDKIKNDHPELNSYEKFNIVLDNICTQNEKVNSDVLRSTIELAIEIAREGREGRKIGTMFIIGDEQSVLASSRPLILDPLEGHSISLKHIDDPNMRETIKELAQLDGAFVVSNDGVVLSATRYIDSHSHDIDLPLGLGSRHVAAASITKSTEAVAIVVSESSVVRLIDDGKIMVEIIPELWLIQSDRFYAGKKGRNKKIDAKKNQEKNKANP
jgi:diadenylate cyclase